MTKASTQITLTAITEIASVYKEYYLSTSKTELKGGSWSTTAPVRTSGTYIWERTVNVYSDGEKTTTSPICTTGDAGVQGCIIIKFEWALNVECRNDETLTSGTRYLHVALVRDSSSTTGWQAYKCKKTHVSSISNAPGNTEFWEEFGLNVNAIFTSLIIAKDAEIEFVQGNQLLVKDAQGKVVGGISGEGKYWMGGETPETAMALDRADGSGHRAGGNLYWDRFGYLYQKAAARILWRSLRDEMNASGIYNNYPIDLLKGSFLDVTTGSHNVTAILPNPNSVPHAIVKTRIIMTTRSTYGVELKCTTGDIFAIVDGAKSYINSIRSDYSTISSVYDEYSQTWEWYAER